MSSTVEQPVSSPTERDWWEELPYRPDSPIGKRQTEILAYLAERSDQDFAISEIATAMNLAIASASEKTKALVGRGLVNITIPVGTGRVRRVRVSAAGMTRIKEIATRQANPPDTATAHRRS